MSPLTWSRQRQILAGILVVLLALALTHLVHGSRTRTVTVEFSQAKGLYVGDSVMILGVKVGKVTSIKPGPSSVMVKLSYSSKYQVPAKVNAILESPNLVTVREVSLAPAYNGGPVLADDARIPMARTAIPVEWDDIKAQVNELTTGLGPKGANAKGSLTRLIEASAANLGGQGTSISQTIEALSAAMKTVADNRGNLFSSARNLDLVIRALAQSDQQITEFNRNLTTVSGVLADNRADLATALKGVTHAFTDLDTFLRQNRAALTQTVRDLRPTTSVLAQNRQRLADLLQLVPHELSNLLGIYDAKTGSVGAALSLANVEAPGLLICSAIYNFGGTPDDCKNAIAPLAGLLTTDPPPIGLSPIEQNNGNLETAPGGKQGPAPGSTTTPGLSDLAALLLGGAG